MMKMYAYEREHIEKLRFGLAECTLFLKHNEDFPLESPEKIAVYGNGARNTIKGGTGSGEVNSRYFVNVERGLKKTGFEVTSKEWLDAYDQVRAEAKKAFIAEVKARAKKKHTMAMMESMGAIMAEPEYELPLDAEGDVAIYVLARNSGEGADREAVAGDICLTKTEIRDILELNRKYKKFMLVLNVGGAVDLSPVDEVDNILLLSQLGVETGIVLAGILLGKMGPSGKLTTTWAAVSDYPEFAEFGDLNDTHYREGIYVGYRYFQTVGKQVKYPFGFGLSYTTFEITPGNVTAEGGRITVPAMVKNTGKYKGKEVVQVYISAPQGKLDQPYQVLAGFAKTVRLQPGETAEVSVSFPLSEIASYDEERSAYILEKGNYIVRVGNSSADTQTAAVLVLDKEVITCQAKACCGVPGFKDWKPEKRTEAESLPKDVKEIKVQAADIPTEHISYEKKWDTAPEVKALSEEELAYMNVGNFNPKGGVLSIIGNAAQSVAGAAGETTSTLKEKGFPYVVMADGPAGLRLSRTFFRDGKGVHGTGQGMIPDSMADFVPEAAKVLMKILGGGSKPKKGQKMEDQYATALPIGTAMAQSWNPTFAETCGDIVGTEMERFGVHLWLAPALNIHRTIRCGRNFEYYSEDPLISGKFAAAVTNGVQKHPGCGTTVKHYAANNQETNRYNSNSMVSERALREIYLKGFGICTKESQPHAFMTSYNLINGQHTSESRDLIENILRCEWGYKGIVMTDWIIGAFMAEKGSIHPGPKASQIAAAGGDLVMPGGKGDVKSILDGLKDGTVTREQLEINATRVYRKAKELVSYGSDSIF